MVIRQYTREADYPVLKDWWVRQGFGELPPEVLPQTGIIAEYQGVMIAAGFLYRSDSTIAWLEWVVANPDYHEANRTTAIDAVIAAAEAEAKAQGFKVLFTSSNKSNLVERLQRLSWSATDIGVTQLIKPII
jgi:hypothetical protein